MRRRKILLALLQGALAICAFAVSWFVVYKQLEYPIYIGMLAGFVALLTTQTFSTGLLYPTKTLAFIAGGSFIMLGFAWNIHWALTVNQRLAWTVAMVAVPAAAFFLGRATNRRFHVKQITID